MTQIKLKKFSKRLRELMDENNETIYTISEILDLSTSTISRYINQKMSPKITTIKILAQYFGVNPVWLMGYEVKKQLKNSCMNLSDEEKELIRKYRKLSESKKGYIQGQLQSIIDMNQKNNSKGDTG